MSLILTLTLIRVGFLVDLFGGGGYQNDTFCKHISKFDSNEVKKLSYENWLLYSPIEPLKNIQSAVVFSKMEQKSISLTGKIFQFLVEQFWKNLDF